MSDVKFSFNSELDNYFNFELDNKIYRMKYPTTEEIKKVDDLNKDLKKTTDKYKDNKKEASSADKTKVEKINKEIEDIVYGSVKPVEEDAPSVKDAIKNWPMRTQGQFYKALYSEYYSLGEANEG